MLFNFLDKLFAPAVYTTLGIATILLLLTFCDKKKRHIRISRIMSIALTVSAVVELTIASAKGFVILVTLGLPAWKVDFGSSRLQLIVTGIALAMWVIIAIVLHLVTARAKKKKQQAAK